MQTYCGHSESLAPLRTYTIGIFRDSLKLKIILGYTGQKKVTLRDYEFNVDNMQKVDYIEPKIVELNDF